MVHLHVVGVLLDVGDDAVFVRDRRVEEVADLTAAAADVEVEVLVDREILEHQVIPVVVRIEVLVESRLRAVDLVGRVERLVGVERSGLLGGVEDCLVVELHVGHAVGHLLYHRGHREGVFQTDRDVHLLRVAAVFRVDEDDAVGAARTVDGGRLSVLEHRERLDRLGRHVVEHVAQHLHAVEDDQRCVARPEGRNAADVEGGAVVAGFARGLARDHAGDVAGERRGQRTGGDIQVGGFYGGDRGDHRLLFLRAVADDHDFVERVALLGERYELEQLGILDVELLRVETDVREGHVFRFGGNGEGVRAVAVGDRAGRRSFDVDHHAGQRRVVGAGDHRAADRLGDVARTAGGLVDADLRAADRVLETGAGQDLVENPVCADVFLADRYDLGQDRFYFIGIDEPQVALRLDRFEDLPDACIGCIYRYIDAPDLCGDISPPHARHRVSDSSSAATNRRTAGKCLFPGAFWRVSSIMVLIGSG